MRQDGDGTVIPFALASVLLDDSLARFDLTEASRPALQILVGSVRHEAADVDIGDALRVLKAFGETELLLICPESWDCSWNRWIPGDKFVHVDHLV